MSALATSSAENRHESLQKPYRDRLNAHIQTIWEECAAEHPVGAFPSSRTMRDNSRLFTAVKRYRYALALAGYQLLTGEPPSRGLERAATWLEWYRLYTLFVDDIMDEDVRRRPLASAWATDAKLYRGPGADRPAVVFRTQRHRYGVSQAILDALRIRSLAERAIEGATDLHPSIRLELLSELTQVDLILSDGQGLDIDFERANRIPEADYVRMSEAKTARLYLGAAATAAIAARASSEDRAALEAFARHFAIAFQDRDDLLGAGVVESRIGGSAEGDIRQGERTPLFVLAIQKLAAKNRGAFLRAYRRGPRADPGPLEANDRLRVVTQHVAAKRHVQARVDVGVHLRRHDDRDASDARRAEELRNLSGESVSLVPPGLVPHREAIVHRDAVDHDESDLGIAVRQLDRLVDQLLLFLEAVRFGEEDVLHDDIEIVTANLLEAIERHALRVDVDHLVSRPHDVPCELQAEIRLAAPGLPVQERDASFLDSPAQEVVQGPTAQGHLHLHRQSPGAL